jgi:Tol biopolymer transport system component
MGNVGEPGVYGSPSLSPDGRRLSFGHEEGGNLDIWIHDLGRATRTRLTFDPSLDAYSVWSPGGEELLYYSDNSQTLYKKKSNGGGEAEVFLAAGLLPGLASDWSKDGKFILLNRAGDFFALAMTAERKPVPLLNTPFTELHGRFSPSKSGPPKWFAYDSDESGARQVFVQPFSPGQPASGARSLISTNGGSEPRWRADGKELYYLSPDRRLMAVSVKADGPVFEAGPPVPLFETTARPLANLGWSYDVTPDGQRFILMEPATETSTAPIVVVVNWQAGLKR